MNSSRVVRRGLTNRVMVLICLVVISFCLFLLYYFHKHGFRYATSDELVTALIRRDKEEYEAIFAQNPDILKEPVSLGRTAL